MARMPSHKFNHLEAVLLICSLGIFALPGCVFRFENSAPTEGARYTHVYFPSATDASPLGGQASRISMAAHRAVALDTRIVLVPVSEAEVAVDLQIQTSNKVTTTVVECKQGNEELASFSRSCVQAKDNLRMPDASVETEAAVMDVRLQIVDLQTGQLLTNSVLKNISSGNYPLVGDDTVKRSLRSFSELHALRYAENVDSAITTIGNQIGAQVLQNLVALQSTP